MRYDISSVLMTIEAVREFFVGHVAWTGPGLGNHILCQDCATAALLGGWLRTYTCPVSARFEDACEPVEVLDRGTMCYRCGKKLWMRYVIGRYLWKQ